MINVEYLFLIYNIPGRSVIDMSVDTMARLFELKNIVGVKDATGDLNRVDQQKNKMGNEFIQLTGNDDNALEFNKRGGVGAISVTGNILLQNFVLIFKNFHFQVLIVDKKRS